MSPGYDAAPEPLVLAGGTVITGDGSTVIDEASVVVAGRLIADVVPGKLDHARAWDLSGCYVFPGLINHHTHGCTFGPLYPSAAPALDEDAVLRNLDRHLLAGTTTILNLDGFALPEEVTRAQDLHPVNIKSASSHTPLNLRAAELADGSGLTPRHRQARVEAMVQAGAVAVGEIGGGHTLGGGGQEYLYIPRAVKQATGVDISPRLARKLKVAVLGRHVDPGSYDPEALKRAMTEAGLESRISPERLRVLIAESVLPSFQVAIDGFREAAEVARGLGLPLVVHNSAPSKQAVLALAKEGFRFIAAHCNHDTFELQEALEVARRLRSLGVLVDVATFDSFGGSADPSPPEYFFAFLESGLVDLLSTDYAGGSFDPIWAGIRAAVQKRVITLPRAVALATSNVADAFPLLAPGRGTIARGKVADLVAVDKEDLGRFRLVMIGGKVVVWQGSKVSGLGDWTESR
ncbi:MAG: amidohydrolase family protein [Bacillota bacterium]